MMQDDSQPLYSPDFLDQLSARYQMLQAYVGWTDDDARKLRSLRGIAERLLAGLVDDFYEQIQLHPEALRVMTGGVDQIVRLKRTLKLWLRELFCGTYDADYVLRHWQVGRRHQQMGLPSIYVHLALARLRQGLMIGLQEIWPGEPTDLMDSFPAFNRLLDLELAIFDLAYEAESPVQEQRPPDPL